MPDGGITSGQAILGAAGIGAASSGLSAALAGQRSQTGVTNQLPPELARLYAIQGNQFQQLAPLQTALQLGATGAFGLQAPNQFAPALETLRSRGVDPSRALKLLQDYGKGVYSGRPEDRDILLEVDQYGSTPNQLSNVLARGAPSTSGTNEAAARLAQELQQSLTQAGQQQDIYQTVSLSPFVQALQSSFTQRPEESAYASRVGQVADPLAELLSGRYNQFRTFSDDLSSRALDTGSAARGMVDNPLDTALLTALTQSLPGIPRAANELVNAPLDIESILGPMRREWNQTIAPNIRTSAIQYGAPRGGAESELFARAGERFSAAGTEAIARQELNRRAQTLQGANLMTDATARGGMLAQAMLQDELNKRWQGLQGYDTALRGQTLAGQTQATALTGAQQIAPLLQALRLAGPQAQAQYAAQGRQLEGQRASVPYDLLRGASVQVPGIPQYPTSSFRTGEETPTTLARIGEGVGGVGQGALLMALMNQGGGGTPYVSLNALNQGYPGMNFTGAELTGANRALDAYGSGPSWWDNLFSTV